MRALCDTYVIIKNVFRHYYNIKTTNGINYSLIFHAYISINHMVFFFVSDAMGKITQLFPFYKTDFFASQGKTLSSITK